MSTKNFNNYSNKINFQHFVQLRFVLISQTSNNEFFTPSNFRSYLYTFLKYLCAFIFTQLHFSIKSPRIVCLSSRNYQLPHCKHLVYTSNTHFSNHFNYKRFDTFITKFCTQTLSTALKVY